MRTNDLGLLIRALLLAAVVALAVNGFAQVLPDAGTAAATPGVAPMSMRPDDRASMTVRALGGDGDPAKLSPSTAAPTPGWTTIMFEDAEGSFPAGNGWMVLDDDANSGVDYWDDLSCRSFAGSWSIWCADIGDQPDCANYDNDMVSWMTYGPFSLADADDARVEFYLWTETEEPDIPYDYVFWGAKKAGSDYWGWRATTNHASWSLTEFDLTAVPTLGDLTGEPEVWFAVVFVSDESVNTFEGSYVDDILIEKRIAASLIFEDGFESGTTTAWARTVTS